MQIDQLITLSTTFATLLCGGGTLLTVRQMVKQRETSYHPELVLSGSSYVAVPTGKAGIPCQWAVSSPPPGEGTEHTPSAIPALDIAFHNVGLGVAKNVSLTWAFQIELWARAANSLAQEALIPAFYSYSNGTLSFDTGSQGSSLFMWENARCASFDYVLPAATISEPRRVALPPAYIHLCSALAYFCFKQKTEQKIIPPLPALSADLEYVDIGGRKHRRRFEFKTEVFYIKGESEEIREMGGNIDCSSVTPTVAVGVPPEAPDFLKKA